MPGRRVPKLPRSQRHLIGREGCDQQPPDELLWGVEQFNAGEYWECHEILERIWREEPRDVRYLYQGVLLVGVGLYHLERRNRHGAQAKLESGLELLERFEPECGGVDVAGLACETRSVLARLTGGPSGIEEALKLPRPRCRIRAGGR